MQIFVRPAKADGTPSVSFKELDQLYSDNQWRLIASPNSDDLLQFTSQTWIYDARLQAGNRLKLADFQPHLSYLLYVFKGEAMVNGLKLGKKDSVLIRGENMEITTDSEAELVLFATDENSEIYRGGMFSGNQF